MECAAYPDLLKITITGLKHGMKKKQKGLLRPYFAYLITILTVFAVTTIIGVAIFTVKVTKSPADLEEMPFLAEIHEELNIPLQGDVAEIEFTTELSTLFANYQNFITPVFTSLVILLIILIVTVILLLILLGCQMIFWLRDRRRLDKWREVGFTCERLEFLPANRIRLNNIELELNKTQVDNLKKLATNRVKGETLHATDMGNHGVQSIKRLREELGIKFFERCLIKARKHEGYWLEIDAQNIHGLSGDNSDDQISNKLP